jgi:putative transposase
MRFSSTIFGQLLEQIDRRAFAAIVERHDGDRYYKGFDSWDHLVALLHGQFGGADSLRAIVESFNASEQHHHHLGCGRLARSTFSDANAARDPRVFADVFAMLSRMLGSRDRSEGKAMTQIIDSTPIPLGALFDWARWNGRIRGMKMHVALDPATGAARVLDITDANVNDAEIGRKATIAKGETEVFDKGYCHYGWWRKIHDDGAFFVTRPKSNMPLRKLRARPVAQAVGDGFVVLADDEVRFDGKSQKASSRALRGMPMRRVRVRRENGTTLTIITNDMERSAIQIALLYKARWQIELLFRWLKQHLKIRAFLGRNDNAIRLQLLAAMIAYALLRLAVLANKIKRPLHRFAELVGAFLFERRRVIAIEKPPPVHPSHARYNVSPNQLSLCYV